MTLSFYSLSSYTSLTSHLVFFLLVCLSVSLHVGERDPAFCVLAVFLLFSVRANLIVFLPHDASAERGDATVSCPSVCLSVCLSVRL